jgi:hypothetical protein
MLCTTYKSAHTCKGCAPLRHVRMQKWRQVDGKAFFLLLSQARFKTIHQLQHALNT